MTRRDFKLLAVGDMVSYIQGYARTCLVQRKLVSCVTAHVELQIRGVNVEDGNFVVHLNELYASQLGLVYGFNRV